METINLKNKFGIYFIDHETYAEVDAEKLVGQIEDGDFLGGVLGEPTLKKKF